MAQQARQGSGCERGRRENETGGTTARMYEQDTHLGHIIRDHRKSMKAAQIEESKSRPSAQRGAWLDWMTLINPGLRYKLGSLKHVGSGLKSKHSFAGL